MKMQFKGEKEEGNKNSFSYDGFIVQMKGEHFRISLGIYRLFGSLFGVLSPLLIICDLQLSLKAGKAF